MGKMLPVPAINGLVELLEIVRDDNKITKYLKQMQELNDNIVENLAAYVKHNDLDMREVAVKNMESASMIILQAAEDDKAEIYNDIKLRRKNLHKLQKATMKGEKDLRERQSTLNTQLETFGEAQDVWKTLSTATDKDQAELTKNLNRCEAYLEKRETEFKDKIDQLKEMFG